MKVKISVLFDDPTFGSVCVTSNVSFDYLKKCISSGTFNGRCYNKIVILNNIYV